MTTTDRYLRYRCELCDKPVTGNKSGRCLWCTEHLNRSTPERARELGAQRKERLLQEHRDKLAQLGLSTLGSQR